MKKRIFLLAICVAIAGGRACAQQQAAKNRPGGQPSKGFKPPGSVKVVRDIVYATYGRREVMLDLYLPRNAPAGKIPCIVTIHGGGYRLGDRHRFARFASKFAESGFVAACIGYRLRPEVKIRQCIEDAKASVRWVRANAARYGIDPDRIGAFGGSAGAHLASMLGTSFKAAKLEGDGGNPGVSSRVRAVVALAPPSDMSAFPAFRNRPEEARLISSITYADEDSAAFLLMHCRGDRIVAYKHSILLRDRLARAGVPVELKTIVRGGHAFWNGDTPKARKAMADTIEFFRKTLKHPQPRPAAEPAENSE